MSPRVLLWVGLIVVVGATFLVSVLDEGTGAYTATIVVGFLGVVAALASLVMLRRGRSGDGGAGRS
jgi:hypothetical protein